MKINLKQTVFVFDLDDTLYKEKDYYLSGAEVIADRILQLYGVDAKPYLKAQIAADNPDLWGALCTHLQLSDSVKESIIWLYRLHQPRLKLDEQVRDLLVWLGRDAPGLAILTDGRSITQRLKAAALGLEHLAIYISEDYGLSKPDPLRFEIIQEKYSGYNCVYIGDNPAKDFLAPKRLGWTTIGLKGDCRNIHSQDTTHLAEEYLPHFWLAELTDLKKHMI